MQETMRAWLFVIAVLATFHSIMQVASTDESSIFTARSSPLTPFSTTTTTAQEIDLLNLENKDSGSHSDSNRNNNSNNSSRNDNRNTNHNTNNDNSDSEKQEINPDDAEAHAHLEKTLLSLFGMKKRPKIIDRASIVIPPAMKALYEKMMGHELKTTDPVGSLPTDTLLKGIANTVRSFPHEGEFFLFHSFFKYIVLFQRNLLKIHLFWQQK